MADDDNLKSMKSSLEDLKTEAKDYRDIMEDNEAFMDMVMAKRAKALRKDVENHREAIREKLTEINKLRDLSAKENAEAIEALQKEVHASEKSIEALDAKGEAHSRMNRAMKKTIAETMQLTQVYGNHESINVDLIARMTKFGMTLTSGANLAALAAGAIGGLVNTMINLIFEVDKTSSALMSQTGINREYADSVFENTQELSRFGVSIEDNAKSFRTLFNGYTDFTFQSRAVQTELKNTTALLEKLGVSSEDTAKGIQLSTKSFGMTGPAAAAAARDLASFASVIQVEPGKLASQFASAGGSLSKLGDDGVRAFKDLTIASKITGLEIEKLLRITDKFDTFDGAAEQAGKLNAALGGNFVNSMDLMMATDPVERFGMIRDSILNTGLSFDDMSYYQRKFFTQAAGLEDVGDLAKMMSGNFDDLAGSQQKSSAEYEDMAAKAKAVLDIQSELKAIMQSFVPILQDVLVEFRDMVKNLEKNEAFINGMKMAVSAATKIIIFFVENIHLLGAAMAAGALWGIGSGVVSMFTSMRGAVGSVSSFLSSRLIPNFDDISISMGNATGSIADATTGVGDFTESFAGTGEAIGTEIDGVADSAEGAGQKLWGLAAVIAAIGVSIGIAAFGMSYLVESFGAAGDNAGMAVLGILAVGAAMAVFGYIALGAAAPAAGLAWSILAIGAAVAIAAYGFSILVESFKGLSTSFETMAGFALILGVIAVSAYALGTAGAVSAGGLVLLAGGLYLLSFSMAALGEEMEPFNAFVAGLNTLAGNIGGLTKVKTEIVAIANAMKGIPETTAISLATVVSTAQAITAGTTAANQSSSNTNQNVTYTPNVEVYVELDGVKLDKRTRIVIGDIVEENALGLGYSV